MKKWIYALLLIPSIGYADIEYTRSPSAIYRTTATWTAAQTFSSVTTIGDLTVGGTCNNCGAGGGGTTLGFRSIFSTNAVVTTNQPDSHHAFIISTGSLQPGTTLYVSSATATNFNSEISTITNLTSNLLRLDGPTATRGLYGPAGQIFQVIGNPTPYIGFLTNNRITFQTSSPVDPYIVGGTASGIFWRGSPSTEMGFTTGARERIKIYSNGPVVFGAVAPGASTHLSTSSLANIPILLVSSDTNKFEIMGDSSTFMNVFSSSWTNVQTVTITEATFAVKNSLNVDRFRMSPSSAFINMPIFINSTMSASNISVSNNSIFYSTQTPAFLAGYVMAIGSFTNLATGGTLVVSPPSGFTNVYFPQVSEFATDAEANQVNISILTETGFTIKNKSALNTKSGVWSCFLK